MQCRLLMCINPAHGILDTAQQLILLYSLQSDRLFVFHRCAGRILSLQ